MDPAYYFIANDPLGNTILFYFFVEILFGIIFGTVLLFVLPFFQGRRKKQSRN